MMMRFCFYPVLRLFILWVKIRPRIGRVGVFGKRSKNYFYLYPSLWLGLSDMQFLIYTSIRPSLSVFASRGDVESCCCPACSPAVCCGDGQVGPNVLLFSRTLKPEGGLSHLDMKSFEEHNSLKRTHYYLYIISI